MIDARLLEILACPICKGPLVARREAQVLVCRLDRLAFPVRDGIAVMLEGEARSLAHDDPLLERPGGSERPGFQRPADRPQDR